MNTIQTFKNPSALKVVLSSSVAPKPPSISDAKRGDLFLRDGAVCMRVEIGKYEMEKNCTEAFELSKDCEKFSIINLQTGRVWFSKDMEVSFIKATLTVEGK